MNAEKGYSIDKVIMMTVVSVYMLRQKKLFSCGMTVSVVVQAKIFFYFNFGSGSAVFVWSGNTNCMQFSISVVFYLV